MSKKLVWRDGVCFTNPTNVNGIRYENLGCFCDRQPWDVPGRREVPRVQAPSDLDVKFKLITRGRKGYTISMR